LRKPVKEEPADIPAYEKLFALLPQAVLLLDERLEVRLANQAAADLFRIPREQLRGTHISALAAHKDLPKLISEFMEERAKLIEIHPQPEPAPQAGRILKITIAPVRSESPPQEFRLLVLEDVTQKVMLEEQLVQAEKLAGMGQLAAGIAHELGNPLGSMSSNLRFLRASLAADGHADLVEPLDTTLDNLERMHDLLRNLAEFTGMRPPRYEPADLDRLIRRSLAFIAKEAETRGIELALSLADNLPTCQLDARAVTQVLLNIFKNAIEAMPQGGRLRVSARLTQAAEEAGEVVRLEIEDTGVGIEEGELRKVFRPLYSTKPGGTGLGLSFCRQVVEEHGGEIRLASRKGHGTKVTVTFPSQQEAAALAAP
jgi:PAS domain S-box-containing protein